MSVSGNNSLKTPNCFGGLGVGPLPSRPMSSPDLMEAVVNLCKRRGFVFPSAEIYGGFRSTYDYGPLGVLMLRNVKEAWWRSMVQRAPTSSASTQRSSRRRRCGRPSATWPRSPTRSSTAGSASRASARTSCPRTACAPSCGTKDNFTEAKPFHLMFKTHAGPVEDSGAVAYLRPETAQGMFTNFANVMTTTRQEAAVRHRPDRQVVSQRDHAGQLRVPHPRVRADGDGVLRPARRGRQVVRVLGAAKRHQWYIDLGMSSDSLRLRPHDAEELSHYSSGTTDVEFDVPVGLGRARRHRQSRRLRPHAARQRTRARSSSTSTRQRRALRRRTSSSPPPAPPAR